LAKILVIDDDPDLRRTMRRILERGGHDVHEAENGLTGIRVVEEELPELVVTDLLMPEKEGIETIVELRERFPSIGIVAVSGAGGAGDRGPLIDAELFGADATLPKPFSIDTFLRTIEGVLESA
jgi:CheY-like chemotaxis protein